MFGFTVKTTSNFDSVRRAEKKAAYRNLSHAAASIHKTEQGLIEQSSDPSDPGEPPHTKRGQLPDSIAYDADETSAVIGPRASVVGESAAVHEFGGEFRGQDYPARPFAGPSLEQNLDRFASDWAGSIG